MPTLTPLFNFPSPASYGPNQSLGADTTFTVPANTRMRLKNVQVVLITDANVANRNVLCTLRPGTSGPPAINWAVTQTASSTEIYECCPQYNQTTVTKTHPTIADSHFTGCPDLILNPGDQIQTNISGIQATDIVQLNLQVDEWTL